VENLGKPVKKNSSGQHVADNTILDTVINKKNFPYGPAHLGAQYLSGATSSIFSIGTFLKPSDCPKEYVEYSNYFKSSNNHINDKKSL
jgi:hypothetical protein